MDSLIGYNQSVKNSHCCDEWKESKHPTEKLGYGKRVIHSSKLFIIYGKGLKQRK